MEIKLSKNFKVISIIIIIICYYWMGYIIFRLDFRLNACVLGSRQQLTNLLGFLAGTTGIAA